MSRKRRLWLTVLLIVLFLFVCSGASLWLSANALTVRKYEVTTENAAGAVRLAVLSDLHDHEFGEGNRELIKKVREQQPDGILLAGDFLNKDSADAGIVCELIRGLAETAPVYAALGNQEMMYMENGNPDLIVELEESGAKVLDRTYEDLEIKGTKLRVGGMYDYAFGLNGKDETEAASNKVKEFLTEFQDTDRVKILMAHRPDSFIFGDASSAWKIDLVVSGHLHGGQVVVPFLGGVYGGDQGWFPEYVHGMYQKDEMKLCITSGLGSQKKAVPRFNNLPEIVILTLN